MDHLINKFLAFLAGQDEVDAFSRIEGGEGDIVYGVTLEGGEDFFVKFERA